MIKTWVANLPNEPGWMPALVIHDFAKRRAQ